MNTSTLTSSNVATATSPAATAAGQEIETLRSQLQAAELRQTTIVESEAQAARKALHITIMSIPALLGVATVREAIALLSEEGKTNGKTRRLPDATVAQMKLMLTSHATTAAVAAALKVGTSTVDAYKSRFGLTYHRNGNGTHNGTVRETGKPPQSRLKRNKRSHRISPKKRAQIIEAMGKPRAKIARIARRFGTSRQTVYSIKQTAAVA